MLSFRPARPEDAEAVTALVNSAYRGEGSKRGWTTEADVLGGQRMDAAWLRELIGRPGTRIELACDAAGTLAACFELRREEGSAYVGMVTVDPARQTGGLGKALLARAEELARQWGCARMRMTVLHVRAELLAYYERRGYRRTGKAEPFPDDHKRYGLPKVPGLTLVELEKPLI
jgi:GNAT superfamily N-acetyltransferase